MRIKLYISLCFVLFFQNELISQGNSNLHLGLGIPQGLNIGYRHQINQFQFGGSIGTVPLNDNENRLILSGDIFYHMMGNSKFSDRKKWYVRTGVTYFRSETEEKIFKDLYTNIRIGREFNLSTRFGIQYELGFAIPIFGKEFQKIPAPPSNNSSNPIAIAIVQGIAGSIPKTPVYPGLELGFFYKL